MSLDLLTAYEGQRAARLLLETTLQRDYPVGAPVQWERNGRLHNGVVHRHSNSDRLEVRNTLTDAVYWICVYDIIVAFMQKPQVPA